MIKRNKTVQEKINKLLSVKKQITTVEELKKKKIRLELKKERDK